MFRSVSFFAQKIPLVFLMDQFDIEASRVRRDIFDTIFLEVRPRIISTV